MKLSYLIIVMLILAVAGCAKEKVTAPSAEYDIQVMDKVQNIYVNLDKPYQLKVNQEYRVLSVNSSEYNSFYMGDTVLVGKRTIYHVYSESPNSSYQGVAMPYYAELKKSYVLIKYLKANVYNATFVAVANANNGNDVAFNVNTSQITVTP
jgi:hypothetical protein